MGIRRRGDEMPMFNDPTRERNDLLATLYDLRKHSRMMKVKEVHLHRKDGTVEILPISDVVYEEDGAVVLVREVLALKRSQGGSIYWIERF